MKISNTILLISAIILLAQSGVLTSTTDTSKFVDFQASSSFTKTTQTSPQAIDSIQKTISGAAYVDIIPIIDTYTLAKTFFNSQKYFGDVCNRCKKLEYISFRMGRSYLTAFSTNLRWTAGSSSGPLNSQLFIAEQQIDGSWAFKSFTEGKYIRADSNGSTVNWQTFVGPWERWYMQRHGNHIHVQSAQFEFYYWINSASVLQQLNGGASMMIAQHWPKIEWLWNWNW